LNPFTHKINKYVGQFLKFGLIKVWKTKHLLKSLKISDAPRSQLMTGNDISGIDFDSARNFIFLFLVNMMLSILLFMFEFWVVNFETLKQYFKLMLNKFTLKLISHTKLNYKTIRSCYFWKRLSYC